MGLTEFPSFISSFRFIEKQSKNELLNIHISLNHYDDPSEPILFVEGKIKSLLLEEVDGHGKVITITTNETMFSFTEKNYNAKISVNAVVFNSKHDNETYYIIEFI